MRRIARLNKAALDAGDFDAGARPAYSPPQWAVELATSLPYDTLFAYHLARPGHINVNEVRGYKSLMKRVAIDEPSTRPVVAQDSLVTIGSSAKGRSSSPAINHVLLGTVPYILGGNLYPAAIHTPSKFLVADDPSRDLPCRLPLREPPRWLDDLGQSRFDRFDRVLQYDSFRALWLAGRACSGP